MPRFFSTRFSPPHDDVQNAFGDGPFFEWWDKSEAGVYAGLGQTLAYLSRLEAEHGPFDGVLGFSQGAGLAALCCALRQAEISARPVSEDVQRLTEGYAGLAPLKQLRCVSCSVLAGRPCVCV